MRRLAGGDEASTCRPARTSTRSRKVPQHVLDELGEVGYWGLLVDKKYGGSGSPFVSFAPFLTKMAMVDATMAGLASVHGCIGAVDPVRTFGNPEQKQQFLPRAGQRQAAVGLRPDRAGRRLGPDRPANHGRARRRRLRRQRREAVHHQRRARPHGRPGLPDRQEAGRAHRRPARGGERTVPAAQATACTR